MTGTMEMEMSKVRHEDESFKSLVRKNKFQDIKQNPNHKLDGKTIIKL